jgi:putative ABC transport system permease protein
MSFLEIIRLAFHAIKGNLLRTTITVLIIAFGILALVGILTIIDGIKGSISNNFSSMGANSFSFRNKESNFHVGRRGKKAKVYLPIKYEEAILFKKVFNFPAKVSINTRISNVVTAEFGSKKTHPNVGLFGVDENYFDVSGYEYSAGRSFSRQENNAGADVAVIGTDVAGLLFKNPLKAINQIISINEKKYRVVGVLKSKGLSSFMSTDNTIYVSVNNARRDFLSANDNNVSYVITVNANSPGLLEGAVQEAEGIFRVVRKVNLKEDNDFDTRRSDDLAQELIGDLKYVTYAATLIGFITLLGAAIGLMNIMLVSVNERTREIGLCKAIGATNNSILVQLFLEAILICQFGGILGVILGLLLGNVIAISVFGGSMIIPWLWIVLGIVLCLVVGVLSGIYPAMKAAKLNPIDALRHD